jgi:hypothetical protein
MPYPNVLGRAAEAAFPPATGNIAPASVPIGSVPVAVGLPALRAGRSRGHAAR